MLDAESGSTSPGKLAQQFELATRTAVTRGWDVPMHRAEKHCTRLAMSRNHQCGHLSWEDPIHPGGDTHTPRRPVGPRTQKHWNWLVREQRWPSPQGRRRRSAAAPRDARVLHPGTAGGGGRGPDAIGPSASTKHAADQRPALDSQHGEIDTTTIASLEPVRR